MRYCLLILIYLLTNITAAAQHMVQKAENFIRLLDSAQSNKALYPFDTTERYRFHYVPQDDRKGISLNELNLPQRKALAELMKTCLSQETVDQVNSIRSLEMVLKEMEQRKPEDHYRDSGKYFITIFGIPGANNIWGWRFEGHHVAFHFSADKNQLIAGTPGFLGSNPAIVQSGPYKNKEVLKKETDMGFALLNALTPEEREKAIIDSLAPSEIVTAASRRAFIDHPVGIRYSELSAGHQQLLLQLINLYVHRYTSKFSKVMLKEIQTAGLNNLWFSWAGFTTHEFGKPYYYRIQEPTIIIEYDNSQNNANHIHTVIRDLNSDFGGDMLLQHYRQSHQ